MRQIGFRTIGVFILGMLTFAVGYFVFTTFIDPKRPSQAGVVEDWGTICFRPDGSGGMHTAVSPVGCYSTTCTRQVQKVGTAVVDDQEHKILLETRFVLAEVSRFPLPCIDNCAGGGIVEFMLDTLKVGDYEVWFRDEKIGNVMIFSGRPTPEQCFENSAP